MAHTVVVLGSGVGGLVTAHRLRRQLPKSHRVVLVDGTPTTGTPRHTGGCSTAAERRSVRPDRWPGCAATASTCTLPTAGPQIGQAVVDLLTRRGIGFRSARQLDHMDPDQYRLVFAGGTEAGCDLVLGVPAHQAPP